MREGEGKGERIGKADDKVTGYGLLTETIFAKRPNGVDGINALRTGEPLSRKIGMPKGVCTKVVWEKERQEPEWIWDCSPRVSARLGMYRNAGWVSWFATIFHSVQTH